MKKLLVWLVCVCVLMGVTACAGMSPEGSVPGGESNPLRPTVSTTATTLEEITGVLDELVTTTTAEDGSITVSLTTTLPVIPTVSTATRSTFSTESVVVIPITTTQPSVTKPAPIPTLPSTTRRPSTTTSKAPTTTAPTTAGKTVGSTGTSARPTTTTGKPTNPTYGYTGGQKHTSLPITERYIYSLLNEQQREWYREIDQAVRNLDSRVSLGVDMSVDRRYYVYYMYMMDNPEHFYLCSTVTVYSGVDGGLIFSYSDGERSCYYGNAEQAEIDDELRAGIRAKKAVFDAEVARIISTVPVDAPAVEKERLLYDRILLDAQYNLGAKWDGLAADDWTAYGVLVNKHGVCESYSEAFQTLCLAVGINCTGVVGTAGGGHKWNAVQLEGAWYACDITFDDPIGGDPAEAYHYYFNRTTAEMVEMNHRTEGSDFPGPACTGTKYGYENYYGRSRWE